MVRAERQTVNTSKQASKQASCGLGACVRAALGELACRRAAASAPGVQQACLRRGPAAWRHAAHCAALGRAAPAGRPGVPAGARGAGAGQPGAGGGVHARDQRAHAHRPAHAALGGGGGGGLLAPALPRAHGQPAADRVHSAGCGAAGAGRARWAGVEGGRALVAARAGWPESVLLAAAGMFGGPPLSLPSFLLALQPLTFQSRPGGGELCPPPKPPPHLLRSRAAAPTAGGYNHDGRLCLAECQVARASDFGANDRTQFARTHLGHVLHVGDVAMGYDVANANLADAELDKLLAAGKVGGGRALAIYIFFYMFWFFGFL